MSFTQCTTNEHLKSEENITGWVTLFIINYFTAHTLQANIIYWIKVYNLEYKQKEKKLYNRNRNILQTQTSN